MEKLSNSFRTIWLFFGVFLGNWIKLLYLESKVFVNIISENYAPVYYSNTYKYLMHFKPQSTECIFSGWS